ncbi:MAG: hypothetical protein JW776_12085 [Candidatus Lokiarchaeota archaeon]|nr:hypothetical protein [Candidatus Lokiarchaeota archaeon]
MGMGIQAETEQIEGRDEAVPREIDFQYVHNVFKHQFSEIDESQRNELTNYDTIQTIRFLLNEYTRSRLIHYDRLNAFLLNIPSISEICKEALIKGTLLHILSNEEQIKEFNSRKEELFSPVVAQSTLFLLKELLKYPFKRTRTLNEHFQPIRELVREFAHKVNPQKKENFHWYYHPSNLKAIGMFFEKNPDLDITQIFPMFYENDEFYVNYTDWLDTIQDPSNLSFDERQADNTINYKAKKSSLKFLKTFLSIYLREAKIPADNDKEISDFIPKIISLELVREIIKFYSENLPLCFPGNSPLRGELEEGIKAFKCILEEYYGQNFISKGYYEFYNKLKRYSVSEKLIDSLLLDLNTFSPKRNSYDVFWKHPFFKIQQKGKNARTEVFFSYVQVLDAFFYFLSSHMKSYIVAGNRGRGFEELVAEKIIKELGIIPQKIIVHDPEKTREDKEYLDLKRQNTLVTPSGIKIPKCIIGKHTKDLDLGENFRWREIDLAFVYKRVLYIIECKNHLFCSFSDFEPIILKRNINARNSTYEKQKMCNNEGIKRSLNKSGGLRYDKVRFIIVSGEECPFDFMLSYQQFGRFLRDFENVHRRLEEINQKFVPKSAYSDKEFKTWSEEDAHDLVEEKLVSRKSKKTLDSIEVEFVREKNSTDSRFVTENSMTKAKIEKTFTKILVESIKKGEELDSADFERYFLHQNPDSELIVNPIVHNPSKIRRMLLTVFHTSFKFKDRDDNSFAIPAECFKYSLAVLEKFPDPKEKIIFVNMLQKTITSMFRNIVVGNRGAGNYYFAKSVEDLYTLLTDFNEKFADLGIKAPSKKKLVAEIKDYLVHHRIPDANRKRIYTILRHF